MGRLALSVVLLVMSAIALISAAELGEELLKNGSFEAADADGRKPSAWSWAAGVKWESDGRNRWVVEEAATPATLSIGQRVPMEERFWKIRVSCKVKVTNVAQGKESWHDARIAMQFQDAHGKMVGGWPNVLHFTGSMADCGKKGTQLFSRNGPKGAAQKRAASPFSLFLLVDGGRIGSESTLRTCNGVGQSTSYDMAASGEPRVNGSTQGRWPANFLLCCLPTCTAEAHDPDCPAARLDRQSGETVSHSGGYGGSDPGMWSGKAQCERGGHNDTGGASRFFFRAVADAIDEADPVRYVPKASRKERDAGCEGFPEYKSATHVIKRQKCRKCGGWTNCGAVTVANRPNSTCQCDEPELEGDTGRVGTTRNHHPTVKPIALARYLATLLLPPAEYAPRRILIPFSGSGSEMIGAMQAGWEEVIGIEADPEYAQIAQARLAYWRSKRNVRPAPGLFDQSARAEIARDAAPRKER